MFREELARRGSGGVPPAGEECRAMKQPTLGRVLGRSLVALALAGAVASCGGDTSTPTTPARAAVFEEELVTAPARDPCSRAERA
jgi:hypothetical protein